MPLNNEHIKLNFVPQQTDGECRCKRCKKLLAKIKSVDNHMMIEIKCTRAHCGLVNTFEVSKNAYYQKEHVGITFMNSSL